MLKLLSF